MKVHLPDWKRVFGKHTLYHLFCGVTGEVQLDEDPDKMTCLNCKRAYSAWQRRKEER